ncbi:MAG: hypothetical protein K9L17_01035 [Clostridiales bacterium]|nr:hypothetical protein [Clostridiales bacterium]
MVLGNFRTTVKPVVVIVLLFLLVLFLAGCGTKDSNTANQEEKHSEQVSSEEIIVNFIEHLKNGQCEDAKKYIVEEYKKGLIKTDNEKLTSLLFSQLHYTINMLNEQENNESINIKIIAPDMLEIARQAEGKMYAAKPEDAGDIQTQYFINRLEQKEFPKKEFNVEIKINKQNGKKKIKPTGEFLKALYGGLEEAYSVLR